MDDSDLLNIAIDSADCEEMNGENENARALLTQCQSLEVEVASLTAKVSQLENERTSLLAVLDQVIKNFSWLRLASKREITKLKRRLKVYHTKAGLPEPKFSSVVDCIKTSLNPCQPLSFSEIVTYLHSIPCDTSEAIALDNLNTSLSSDIQMPVNIQTSLPPVNTRSISSVSLGDVSAPINAKSSSAVCPKKELSLQTQKQRDSPLNSSSSSSGSSSSTDTSSSCSSPSSSEQLHKRENLGTHEKVAVASKPPGNFYPNRDERHSNSYSLRRIQTADGREHSTGHPLHGNKSYSIRRNCVNEESRPGWRREFSKNDSSTYPHTYPTKSGRITKPDTASVEIQSSRDLKQRPIARLLEESKRKESVAYNAHQPQPSSRLTHRVDELSRDRYRAKYESEFNFQAEKHLSDFGKFQTCRTRRPGNSLGHPPAESSFEDRSTPARSQGSGIRKPRGLQVSPSQRSSRDRKYPPIISGFRGNRTPPLAPERHVMEQVVTKIASTLPEENPVIREFPIDRASGLTSREDTEAHLLRTFEASIRSAREHYSSARFSGGPPTRELTKVDEKLITDNHISIQEQRMHSALPAVLPQTPVPTVFTRRQLNRRSLTATDVSPSIRASVRILEGKECSPVLTNVLPASDPTPVGTVHTPTGSMRLEEAERGLSTPASFHQTGVNEESGDPHRFIYEGLAELEVKDLIGSEEEVGTEAHASSRPRTPEEACDNTGNNSSASDAEEEDRADSPIHPDLDVSFKPFKPTGLSPTQRRRHTSPEDSSDSSIHSSPLQRGNRTSNRPASLLSPDINAEHSDSIASRRSRASADDLEEGEALTEVDETEDQEEMNAQQSYTSRKDLRKAKRARNSSDERSKSLRYRIHKRKDDEHYHQEGTQEHDDFSRLKRPRYMNCDPPHEAERRSVPAFRQFSRESHSHHRTPEPVDRGRHRSRSCTRMYPRPSRSPNARYHRASPYPPEQETRFKATYPNSSRNFNRNTALRVHDTYPKSFPLRASFRRQRYDSVRIRELNERPRPANFVQRYQDNSRNYPMTDRKFNRTTFNPPFNSSRQNRLSKR